LDVEGEEEMVKDFEEMRLGRESATISGGYKGITNI